MSFIRLMFCITIAATVIMGFFIVNIASPLDTLAVLQARDLQEARSILEKAPGMANEFDSEGWAPLHRISVAIEMQMTTDKDGKVQSTIIEKSEPPPIAVLLIEKGADINARTKNTYAATPLGLALGFWNSSMAKLLIDKGADIDLPCGGKSNFPPLHFVVDSGNEPIVKLLLAKGAKVSKKTMPGGDTPLHIAVRKNNSSLVKILLDHGADVNSRNEGGQTPLSLAQEAGLVEIISLLRSKTKMQ